MAKIKSAISSVLILLVFMAVTPAHCEVVPAGVLPTPAPVKSGVALSGLSRHR